MSPKRNEPPCEFPRHDIGTVGMCEVRPCLCQIALVVGCTCGLYHDPFRRAQGHHSATCKLRRNR